MPVEPVATYRFQLSPAFGFADVTGLLAHVQRLGATHVYLSPIAQALPESTHGYDVVDHTAVRAEFGGDAGFENLLEAVAVRRMAVIVDHVPGHIGVADPSLNQHWWNVMRDGQRSASCDWFDIDWDVAGDKLIVPALDGSVADTIAAGGFEVDGDSLLVGDIRFPLAAGTDGASLPELLDAQHYVLVDRNSSARNVRRLFAVDDLVAVRVESEHIASVVDTIPERYAPHQGFGGVRVGHIDGLADPVGYLHGLRNRLGDDALVYVEKITAPGEWLPRAWPVDGTTGYEFMRSVDHVMLADDAEAVFTRRWAENSPGSHSFAELSESDREFMIDGALAPDFERLVRLAASCLPDSEGEQNASELRHLTTGLPRYRTYLPDDPDAVDVIASVATGPVASALLAPTTPAQVELRTRWQQLTAAVMAKGVEDRTFYRYLRLASLGEVGGSPDAFGMDVGTFHAENSIRQRRWPRTLLASSTHDSKRSEDVRARGAAITWRVVDRRFPLPNGRHATGDRWAELSRSWVADVTARTGLDAVQVALAVQTLVCAPGLDAERLWAFLVEIARETTVHPTRNGVDTEYEARLWKLAELVVAGPHVSALGLEAIGPGISLAATVLKLTSPGVPDIYQGSEAFTYRLLAPDNRVPPDWDALQSYSTDDRTVADLWSLDEPSLKTTVIRVVLDLRRRRAESFGPDGAYTPIDAGPGVIAYGRGDDVVVAVRRGLADVEGTFEFPPGGWYDVLDPEAPTLAGTVAVASLVGSGADLTLPIAVFERD